MHLTERQKQALKGLFVEGWWAEPAEPQKRYMPFKPLLEKEARRLTGVLTKVGKVTLEPTDYKSGQAEEFWATEWVVESKALDQAKAIIRKAGYRIYDENPGGFHFRHRGYTDGTETKRGENRFDGWVEAEGDQLHFYFAWNNTGALSYAEYDAPEQ